MPPKGKPVEFQLTIKDEEHLAQVLAESGSKVIS